MFIQEVINRSNYCSIKILSVNHVLFFLHDMGQNNKFQNKSREEFYVRATKYQKIFTEEANFVNRRDNEWLLKNKNKKKIEKIFKSRLKQNQKK